MNELNERLVVTVKGALRVVWESGSGWRMEMMDGEVLSEEVAGVHLRYLEDRWQTAPVGPRGTGAERAWRAVKDVFGERNLTVEVREEVRRSANAGEDDWFI